MYSNVDFLQIDPYSFSFFFNKIYYDRQRYARNIHIIAIFIATFILPLIIEGTKSLSSCGRNEFLRPNMADTRVYAFVSKKLGSAFHRLFPILPFKSPFNAGRKGLGEGRKAEREFHRITVMLTTRDGILMDRGRGSLQRNCLTGIYHGLRADIYVQ